MQLYGPFRAILCLQLNFTVFYGVFLRIRW